MKKIFKRIGYYLQLVDGIWSVPLMFTAFWLIGVLLQLFIGPEVGVYDIAFIQPLFIAAGVVIGATNVAIGGLYFTFRGIYRYIYGQYKEIDGVRERVNYSKIDWVKLSVWQRYLIWLFAFFYYVTATILVYIQLV